LSGQGGGSKSGGLGKAGLLPLLGKNGGSNINAQNNSAKAGAPKGGPLGLLLSLLG
jgi:hypothetical protein